MSGAGRDHPKYHPPLPIINYLNSITSLYIRGSGHFELRKPYLLKHKYTSARSQLKHFTDTFPPDEPSVEARQEKLYYDGLMAHRNLTSHFLFM